MPQLHILCAVLAWCVLRPAPAALSWYFRFQLAATFSEDLAIATLGESGKAYAAVYLAASGLVWISMLRLSWDVLRPKDHPFLCYWAGVGFAMLFGIPSLASYHAHFYDWVNLADASVSVSLAIPCGLGAAANHPGLTLKDRKVGIILMVSWLGCASFEYAFIEHVWDRLWMQSADWVPCAIVMVSCAWLSRLSVEAQSADLHRKRHFGSPRRGGNIG